MRPHAMTRDDVKTIIVDALRCCATLGWTHRHDLQADLILRGLKAAEVKMRGPKDYSHEWTAEFMRRLLAIGREARLRSVVPSSYDAPCPSPPRPRQDIQHRVSLS